MQIGLAEVLPTHVPGPGPTNCICEPLKPSFPCRTAKPDASFRAWHSWSWAAVKGFSSYLAGTIDLCLIL